jgi:pimeloyl-ACP methyl ester carboxylesterase
MLGGENRWPLLLPTAMSYPDAVRQSPWRAGRPRKGHVMHAVTDVTLTDGRNVRVHDSGPPPRRTTLTVLWHHGSPQTGALLDPLVEAARARNIRLLSYARPSYAGSTPNPGRDVASAAADVAAIAAALGIDRMAMMGASGGGPHALACAALLPDRVVATACLAGIAPYTTDFDWYSGMASDGGLRAAAAGRQQRAQFAETEEFDESCFVDRDWAALAGDWAALGEDAGAASAAGPDGLIDDDVAFAGPWGFALTKIESPVLLVQGGRDRVVPPAHAEWLGKQVSTAELWLRPTDGHISVLAAVPVAMDWLLAARSAQPG